MKELKGDKRRLLEGLLSLTWVFGEEELPLLKKCLPNDDELAIVKSLYSNSFSVIDSRWDSELSNFASIVFSKGYHHEKYWKRIDTLINRQQNHLKKYVSKVQSSKKVQASRGSYIDLTEENLALFNRMANNAINFWDLFIDTYNGEVEIEKESTYILRNEGRLQHIMHEAFPESFPEPKDQLFNVIIDFLNAEEYTEIIGYIWSHGTSLFDGDLVKGEGTLRSVDNLSKDEFQSLHSTELPHSGDSCSLCGDGYISELYGSYGCTNKECLWGVGRHYSDNYLNGYLFPSFSRGAIANYYWTMEKSELDSLVKGQLAAFEITANGNPLKSESGEKFITNDVKPKVRDEFQVLDVITYNDSVTVAMLKPLGNEMKYPEVIAVINFNEYYEAVDALFNVNRPKRYKPFMELANK